MTEPALPVTVVTPVFNGAQFIEATIHSVLAQTYSHIEYLIMDGGSTDGTIEIARRYANQLTVISEPDKGQSDAINKGWRQASGDILAWLCADDLYEPDTVATALDVLNKRPDVDWVYGSGQSLDAEGRPRPFRHAVEPWDYERLVGVHNFIIQPSVFMRKGVFQKYGELRSDLHYTMDYEYWLRIGRTSPGTLCPEIQVQVKRYAAAKTHSGGTQRLDELMELMHEYGREELPTGSRHEWATAYLKAGVSALGHADWNGMKTALAKLTRYPGAIPRGTFKAGIELLPASVDRQLRRWFVRAP